MMSSVAPDQVHGGSATEQLLRSNRMGKYVAAAWLLLPPG